MKLYGIVEVAAELGVSRNLIGQWRQRGKLPPPDAELAACGPVWTEQTIRPWLRQQKRGSQRAANVPRN